MRIIIEEHQYDADRVKKTLEGISNLQDLDGKISVSCVGYYYNPTLKDCVFILPKVLMADTNELVFGHCRPEDIIDLEAAKELGKTDPVKGLSQEEHSFIYELAVWIYRAIVVYRDTHDSSKIIKQQFVQQMSKGRLQKSNTFLDIILALQKFNRENQNFFFFVLRNLHSGFNKINWTRTIAHSQAFVQHGTPVYLDPVNKKRQVNFDEELLIIFFSILNYINKEYGFPVELNVNFPLITGKMFDNYRKGMGRARLLQIKYKYFSDKALYLWELCYAFFEQSKKINVETDDKEYLIAMNFNIVFEAIIDELIGSTMPDGLKDQGDGKRVDHMYQYRNLTNNADDKPIYYIGDSKYYKRGHKIGAESVYKQFTYARNVIQWNLDLFNDGKEEDQKEHLKLRDDVTEGYNIIPNFFISAQQNTLKRENDIKLTTNESKYFVSRQYDNRLFDRDTFLIAHYDVNFLYVVALYGQNNSHEKKKWREKVKEMFRKEIQIMLEEKFQFYAMTAHADVHAVSYLEDHFQELLGKVFTPYEDRGLQKFYSLALDKRPEFADENATILAQLQTAFYVQPCAIGTDPKTLFDYIEPRSVAVPTTPDFLTMHYLEKYADKSILIGCYHNLAHLEWILGKNDRGTLIYNIRLGKDVPGGQVKAQLDKKVVSFVILYEEGHEAENRYRVFRVHHHATMTADRLKQSKYPSKPSASKYFCYVFDEEVTLGNLDIAQLLSDYKSSHPATTYGEPLFLSGEDVKGYRR